jgi:CubicO group peptidase (beta-lactamase class C family)
MKRFALFLALLLTTAAAVAGEIDAFVDQTLREFPGMVPSIALVVVQNGKVVYVREPKTPYYIGSTTKAYTGLACAILAQGGKLDLDAPITKYLPEAKLEKAPTLRAFLTHTSGIENDPITFRTAFTGEHTPALLVSLLGTASRPAKPGFQYDNLGYVIASLAIERVTGKPWQDALDELVFAPLGMRHTTAYMSKAGKLPAGYVLDRKGELAPVTLVKNDKMMHAAGGIVTTPSDLGRWLEANVTKGRLDGKQRIPAAAFEEAQRLQVPVQRERSAIATRGYGFGWYLGDYDGEEILYHGGGFPGWHSLFTFMPKRGIAVGMMTNTSSMLGGGIGDKIVSGIYDRLLDKPAPSIAELKDLVGKRKQGYLDDTAKRAQRSWMLKHPNAAYTGRYENAGYGTISIEERDGKLYASMANLRGVLEAFTQPETARVELVPEAGEVVAFHFADDGTVDTLTWDREVFRRVRP